MQKQVKNNRKSIKKHTFQIHSITNFKSILNTIHSPDNLLSYYVNNSNLTFIL